VLQTAGRLAEAVVATTERALMEAGPNYMTHLAVVGGLGMLGAGVGLFQLGWNLSGRANAGRQFPPDR